MCVWGDVCVVCDCVMTIQSHQGGVGRSDMRARTTPVSCVENSGCLTISTDSSSNGEASISVRARVSTRVARSDVCECVFVRQDEGMTGTALVCPVPGESGDLCMDRTAWAKWPKRPRDDQKGDDES